MADIEQITVGPGAVVTMNFSLTIKDGPVADATVPGEPMTFTMGDGSLINGLEMAITGLKAGDKTQVELDPLNAFGFPDPDNVHYLPRAEFNESLPLEPDTVIGFSTPSGDEIPGTIVEVTDETVKVDFNHPLAGLDLIFAVDIVDIKSPAAAKKEIEND